MNEQDRHNLFSELVAHHQSGLYAYIFAIVQNWADADDLYQATCLVLWRKFDSFEPGSSFFAWARQTAKIEVRSFLRRKQSPAYVCEELVDALAELAVGSPGDDAELYLASMQQCRKKLNAADAELLQLRYVEALGIREIAERQQRFQSNVCRSLNRIRRWLLDCIKTELGRHERSEDCPS
jgi:RNA polymerase sigma-70 factor (ECF subfamily)